MGKVGAHIYVPATARAGGIDETGVCAHCNRVAAEVKAIRLLRARWDHKNWYSTAHAVPQHNLAWDNRGLLGQNELDFITPVAVDSSRPD